MHAFLITGINTEEIGKSVNEIAKRQEAKVLDFDLQKIADVRELLNFTKVSLPEKTAIVIQNINLATEEAQNAFLKALEEPQKNVVYILTASSVEGLLSTIVSRVNIIETKYIPEEVSKEKVKEVKDFLEAETGERLKTTSQIKDRGEAIEWVTSLIRVGHKFLVENGKYTNEIEAAIDALKALKLNGNVQLQLTNMVVQMES